MAIYRQLTTAIFLMFGFRRYGRTVLVTEQGLKLLLSEEYRTACPNVVVAFKSSSIIGVGR